MARSKGKRRVLIGIGALVLLIVAVLAAMPLWLPWVFGGYQRYQRKGYGKFVLHSYVYTNNSTTFRAGRVEVQVPTVWLWNRWAGHTNQPFVNVENWQLNIAGQPAAPPPSPAQPSAPPPQTAPGQAPSTQAPPPAASGITPLAQKLASTLTRLRHWVPRAVATKGTINIDGRQFLVPQMSWSAGNWSATIIDPRTKQSVLVRVDTTGPQYRLDIVSQTLQLAAAGQAGLRPAGLHVQAHGIWRGNPFSLEAQFGPTGMLPRSGFVTATNFTLPASLLRLPAYGQVRGSLNGRWQNGDFGVDLSATANPAPQTNQYPPLDLTLHARGDTNSVIIDRAELVSPWLRTELSRQTRVYFTAPYLRGPAALGFVANLEEQAWLPLHGILTGAGYFQPGPEEFPEVEFKLSGAKVGNQRLEATQADVEGTLQWPWLQLTNVDARFADGSTLTATGNFQVPQKIIQDGRLEFQGRLAQQFLPAGIGYTQATASVTFHGPLDQLLHQGQLEIHSLTNTFTRPLQVAARWTGSQFHLTNTVLSVQANNSTFLLQGDLNLPTTNRFSATLNKLDLLQNQKTLLLLTNTAHLTLVRAPEATNPAPASPWSVSIHGLHLSGPAGSLALDGSVQWPGRGNLVLSARHLDSQLLDLFLKQPQPNVTLDQAHLAAAWTNGPLLFQAQIAASIHTNVEAGATATLHGNASGLDLQNFTLTTGNTTVAAAHGRLPLTLNPAAPKLVNLDTNAPFRLSAELQPRGQFWDQLLKQAGIQARGLGLKLAASGTLAAPVGQLHLVASSVRTEKVLTNIPSLEDLRATVQLDRHQARLTQGSLRLFDQPVNITGDLPLTPEFWAALRSRQPFPWNSFNARIQVPQAKVAAFQPLLVKTVAPQGDFTLDLALHAGGNLSGFLSLTNARTRPIANLGPVRDISLRLNFLQRTLRLEHATGKIGGSTVSMSGEGDLRGTAWLEGATPPFVFKLHGTNVPLSRTPESIIRSDLDLQVIKTNDATPLITGEASLRNSFFLTDLKALVPGGVASPKRRPPYFSIEEEPLAGWQLAVHVTGENFLKVRSPIFNGEVSANLRVRGTLKDPIALGDVKINSGTVRFPFANLDVQQGFVTLTSEDPYLPQINLTAASKQFGYDIHMSVTGPVTEPVLQFTSTPPLSSEQILLMVTAGDIPHGEFNLTPQQRAQGLAVFLARDLLAKFGLGDQADQRLTVRSGEEISQQGKPTYTIEYKLTPRWSITGEYDRFGDYNAGVKWRVYSK